MYLTTDGDFFWPRLGSGVPCAPAYVPLPYPSTAPAQPPRLMPGSVSGLVTKHYGWTDRWTDGRTNQPMD